jgi:hypothetical protein
VDGGERLKSACASGPWASGRVSLQVDDLGIGEVSGSPIGHEGGVVLHATEPTEPTQLPIPPRPYCACLD